MAPDREVVITGLGVISPLGIGRQAFWSALLDMRSGIGQISTFDASSLPVRLAAEVRGFSPQEYVKPRKSLKVMARDTQFGMTAATLARDDARLDASAVDPDRFGVVFSADTINPTTDESFETYRPCIVDGKFRFERWGTDGMASSFPLGMLKLLPNMLACHISIAHDARNHNNTLYTGEVSGLLALGEAASVIARGAGDVMLAGGASSRMQPIDWAHAEINLELSRRHDAPEKSSRPFDAQRDGQVRGEGGAVLVFEERHHAERRGANILARVLAWASSADPLGSVQAAPGIGLRNAIARVLERSGLSPGDLGHVNAHGLSTRDDDRIEAEVLADLLPGVPVTAPKSYFGNLFAAGGAVEAAVSVLALVEDRLPPVLNYEHPDPECPLNIVRGEPLSISPRPALLVNRTTPGQAAAVIIAPA